MTPDSLIKYPTLSLAEQFLIVCSDYDLASEDRLRTFAVQFNPEDWQRFHRSAHQHQLGGYLWYQLERCVDAIPPEMRVCLKGDFNAAFDKDLRQAIWMEQLCLTFEKAGVPFAVVKGPFLQQWLYQDRSLPRGPADLDFFVPGGFSSFEKIIPMIEADDFVFSPYAHSTWQEEFFHSHDIAFMRPSSNSNVLKLDLHHAPSVYHRSGSDSRRLIRWIESQRMVLPWRSPWPYGPKQIPSLTPEGHFIYLTINLLKDGTPILRNINDIALLVHQFGRQMRWDQISEIAQCCRLTPAVEVALKLAYQWRGVKAPREVLESQWTKRFWVFLDAPAVVRWPGEGMMAHGRWRWMGESLPWWSLFFGHRACWRMLIQYEEQRFDFLTQGRAFWKWTYWVIRPFELAARFFKKLFR